MINMVERNKSIRGLNRNIKECQKLESQRRDTLFICGVLSIMVIMSVIAFGKVMITFSWISTSVLSIYLFFKLMYIRYEEKETKNLVKKVARELLDDEDLEYATRRKIENLLITM